MCNANCPDGMWDLGLTCNKKTEGRGMGHPLTCDKDQDQELLLCYPKCKHGTWGLGPVCWGGCPAGTTQCGALCLADGEACSQIISKEVKGVLETTIQVASKNAEGTVIDL